MLVQNRYFRTIVHAEIFRHPGFMKTTRKHTKAAPAPKMIEVTMDTPQAIKELNAQVGRMADAHERMVSFLDLYRRAIEMEAYDMAREFHTAMRQEMTFLAQVARATDAKLVEVKDYKLAAFRGR